MIHSASYLSSAVLIAIAIVCASARVDAALAPNEVAIIAARGNAQSRELAEYYANARAISVTNICALDVPAGDELSRADWDAKVRPAIRKWLAENDPDHKVRCLTTVWGVPLRIGAAAATPAYAEYQAFLAGERSRRLAALADAIKDFDGLAPAGAITTNSVGGAGSRPGTKPADATPVAAPDSPAAELKQLKDRLDDALKGAQGRIGELPQGSTRERAQSRIQQLVAAVGGAGVILQNLNSQMHGAAEPRPEVVAEYHRLRGAAAAWIEARQLLEQRPPGIERDVPILGLVERIGGLMETIAWLDAQIADVAKNETGAALDSELALVLWPENYQLLRWQPNYLNSRYARSQLPRTYPTLMTARIDAPSAALARGMVDAALAAEAAGLAGKAYIDSRGLAKQGAPGSGGEAAEFDAAMAGTAEGIRSQTTVEIVVNDEPRLFGPGECPDAAIYCGWYSLGKYVDAFEFNQGAVAYHVASDEAAGLHDAGSQRWCKRLIEDGAAATIGAVSEPYLTAFPRPDEFFSALLAGELTLAECYWQASPTTSWSMILLGDPLYRPFKNRHVQKQESVIRAPGH